LVSTGAALGVFARSSTACFTAGVLAIMGELLLTGARARRAVDWRRAGEPLAMSLWTGNLLGERKVMALRLGGTLLASVLNLQRFCGILFSFQRYFLLTGFCL